MDAETETTIGDKPWFIEFYASWCPKSKKLNPIWDEYYTLNKDKLNIARIMCDSLTGEPLCDLFDIDGYPTLLYFPLGKIQYTEYYGHRRVELFEEWVEKMDLD